MAPKRPLVLTAAIVIMSACVVSQAAPAVTDNLYSVALKASILQMEKEWGPLGYSAAEGGMPPDYRHMIVQKDPIITDGLPTAFEDHAVEYLDDQEIVNRYQKLNRSFEVLKIGPIRNEGAVLKIVVSTYWVSYKGYRLTFGYSDWSNVQFQYDCEQQRFVIASVKLGGI